MIYNSNNLNIKRFLLFGLLLGLMLSILSCNPTKRVPQGSYLLKSNTVRLQGKVEFDEDELPKLIIQKPNRKLLFILRFHLWLYNQSNPKSDSKFQKWLRSIGEEPVVLDDSATSNSVAQIRKYLFNKGYFNASVKDSVAYLKKRRMAKVYYTIKPGLPYRLRKINYEFEDPSLSSIILSDTSNRLFGTNSRFDVDKIEEERMRITTYLRNNGYFEFIKDYIQFEADSGLRSRKVDLNILFKAPVAGKDTSKKLSHKVFSINRIAVYPDYSQFTLLPDTVQPEITLFKEYAFYTIGKKKFKERALAQCIFIRKDYLYDYSTIEKTYTRLLETQAFRFVDIELKRLPVDSSHVGLPYPLQCNIRMNPLDKQYYSIEAQGTNAEGNLGLAGNINYNHRNLFKGIEAFSLHLIGEMEFQKNFVGTENNLWALPFNTFKYGAEAKMTFPKFLIPVRQERFSKNAIPKTTLSIGYNVQYRTDFTRNILNFSFGYEWKETASKKHIVYPADVNVVNVAMDSAFQAKLYKYQNPEILYSYQNHLIPGMRYSFILNNQVYNTAGNFIFFRTNVEAAGNLLRLANIILKTPKSYEGEGFYKFIDIRYTQFFKIEMDFRKYKRFNAYNDLVYRLRGGIGYAYGNSNTIPFEKSFFLGGANSLRAWAIYSLGPGSYRETFATKTADIVLEANAEWRFGLYKIFKGAFFVDAGNIWLAKNDPERPNAEFKVERFAEEIAIGSGFGIRLDFSFFVIRVDLGIKLRDPYIKLADRWVISHFFDKEWKENYKTEYGSNNPYNFTNVNIGIGYPF